MRAVKFKAGSEKNQDSIGADSKIMIQINNNNATSRNLTSNHGKYDKTYAMEDDEAVKIDYETDEDEDIERNHVISNNLKKPFTKKSNNAEINSAKENSILDVTKAFNSNSKELNIQKNENKNLNDRLDKQTDSISSSESGFGTVDDENENNASKKCVQNTEKNISNKSKLCNMESTLDSSNVVFKSLSTNNNNSSTVLGKTLQNSFPLLQPPRQIVYELNSNRSDDFINILNDNSSLSSSISSENGITLKNCCPRLFNKLVSFYYSCFCCYLTSNYSANSPNTTPFVCSWLSIFCCCCPFLGAISLFLTHRSRKYKLKQKYDLAEKYSNYAEKLNIAALIFGVIFYAIAFFLVTLVIFMYWRSKSS
jgi:hypothetical protein